MLHRVLMGAVTFCIAMGVCLAVTGIASVFISLSAPLVLFWSALIGALAGAGVFCAVWLDDIHTEEKAQLGSVFRRV